MSTAHDNAHAAAEHSADAHHLDLEPARALPEDEPPTPLWVPALGLALFVVAGVAFLAVSASDEAPEQAPSGAQEQEVAPKPAPAPPPRGAVRQLPGNAAAEGAPQAAPSPTVRKLSPQEADMVRKRIEDAARQKGQQGQPTPGH
jgi:hypothetical protein